MEGHQRRRHHKMKSIMDAAEALFSEQGIDVVSMDAIASRAGVSKMTLYNYYGTKDALICEVFKRVFDQALADAESLLHAETSAVAMLSAIIQLKRAAAERFGGAVVMEAYIHDHSAPRTQALMVRFFEVARAQGVLRANISNERLLLYFDIFNAGLAAQAEHLGPVLQEPDAFQAMVEIFFYGIADPTAEPITSSFGVR